MTAPRYNGGMIDMTTVTIYTRDFCGYCTRALRLLERKNADVRLVDAGADPDLRREMIQRANGRTTYPQIFVGEHHVGGWSELAALDRDGRLDPLLAGEGAA
jgi:glutaredoxin 3